MGRTLFSLVLLLLLPCLEPRVCVATETLEQQLDAIVQSGIETKAYPGAVLIAGSPNETYHARAYGHYFYGTSAPPMTLNTLFDMASVSKVVGTATATMKLIEENKLTLDTRISKYIPEFTTGGKELVTVKDLLTHVSGLKSYDSAANAEKARLPGQSNAEALIQRIASLPASYPPRSKTVYSCLNMLMLAHVNEQVLQGSMDKYLQEKIYGPLGMLDTTYRPTAEQLKRTAPTMIGNSGEANTGRIHDPLASFYSDADHCSGNAGLFSTAPDLAWYCAMVLNEGEGRGRRVFKPETIQLMTSLQSPEGVTNLRGLGWDIQVRPPKSTPLNQSNEARILTHTGYTGTMLWLDKLSKSYFVFLTNRTIQEGPGESKASVEKQRNAIANAILASRPEYGGYFAGAQAAE